jgi:hypothetical protein
MRKMDFAYGASALPFILLIRFLLKANNQQLSSEVVIFAMHHRMLSLSRLSSWAIVLPVRASVTAGLPMVLWVSE